jgi:site-specific DNA-adenine methylase|tara:strand:- start:1125 stop:1325 length:201 start_codon:yes stop_codon:yes gene_type:complete
MEQEEKFKKIILDYKIRPNKDLIDVMDFLQQDYEETKKNIIKLTHHLDSSELIYKKILKEFKERTK